MLPRRPGIDLEFLFEQRQVLVEPTKKFAGETVVFKGEREVGRVGRRLRRASQLLSGTGAQLSKRSGSKNATGVHSTTSAKRLPVPGCVISHPDNVTDFPQLCINYYRLQPGRPANQLASVAPRLLQQQIHHFSDTFASKGPGLLGQKVLKPRQTLGLDRLIDLVLHVGARRAGTDRVFEGKGGGVVDLADQPHRVFEIGVCFAGKADDEIARQRDIGPGGANPLDQAEIILGRMTPGSWP